VTTSYSPPPPAASTAVEENFSNILPVFVGDELVTLSWSAGSWERTPSMDPPVEYHEQNAEVKYRFTVFTNREEVYISKPPRTSADERKRGTTYDRQQRIPPRALGQPFDALSDVAHVRRRQSLLVHAELVVRDEREGRSIGREGGGVA
jgi:hypothetical protein